MPVIHKTFELQFGEVWCDDDGVHVCLCTVCLHVVCLSVCCECMSVGEGGVGGGGRDKRPHFSFRERHVRKL